MVLVLVRYSTGSGSKKTPVCSYAGRRYQYVLACSRAQVKAGRIGRASLAKINRTITDGGYVMGLLLSHCACVLLRHCDPYTFACPGRRKATNLRVHRAGLVHASRLPHIDQRA